MSMIMISYMALLVIIYIEVSFLSVWFNDTIATPPTHHPPPPPLFYFIFIFLKYSKHGCTRFLKEIVKVVLVETAMLTKMAWTL